MELGRFTQFPLFCEVFRFARIAEIEIAEKR